MNRRDVIGLIGLSAVAGAEAQVRDRFIGVWGLVSCERKFTDGRREYPYGEKPVGRITYDEAGRMSAQLMRRGRKSTLPSGVSLFAGNASIEEIREALNGFIAYFGKFDVDEASNTVIHHVEASLVPSWVGTDLKRTYHFSSNRLTLVAASANSSTELVWEKQPD
jgi:hypothetical protein